MVGYGRRSVKMIEGMIIAAYAVGAENGIYVRQSILFP